MRIPQILSCFGRSKKFFQKWPWFLGVALLLTTSTYFPKFQIRNVTWFVGFFYILFDFKSKKYYLNNFRLFSCDFLGFYAILPIFDKWRHHLGNYWNDVIMTSHDLSRDWKLCYCLDNCLVNQYWKFQYCTICSSWDI